MLEMRVHQPACSNRVCMCVLGTQVHGVEWNPFQSDDIPASFVTFGRKHIKLWTSEDPKGNSGWKAKQLSFGKLPMQVGLAL